MTSYVTWEKPYDANFASDVRWLEHYGFSAFATPNPATGLS